MAKYRKKPVVIEAFRLGVDPMPDWFMAAVSANTVILHGFGHGSPIERAFATIKTLEGYHRADACRDWVLRGVKGELYPCKPDIFAATYDAADGEINGWKPPVIYDIGEDNFRIATQGDIDRLAEVNRAYGELIGKCREILAAHDALVAKVRADLS